jgi:GT2 family glycosyltransferase
VIVGFRNAGDICRCLSALASARRDTPFSIHICENGGTEAYEAVIAAVSNKDGPCGGAAVKTVACDGAFVQARLLKLAGDIDVFVGEAKENFGYAGGINACIEHLLQTPGWPGLWVLNPDTAPAPDALSELVDYAEKYGKGMVGSRVMPSDDPSVVASRGLAWSFLLSGTIGVDKDAPVAPEPDRLDVEKRIDGPHGGSFYVTRPCLDKIGPMDDRYFLYFEDLDWGLKAKANDGLGYAYRSIVPHVGGTTIGSARRRRDRSRLAVYLDFRNRLLFVRKNYPGWYPWTVVMVLARSLEYLPARAFRNFAVALSGWGAGIQGKTGKPDFLI